MRPPEHSRLRVSPVQGEQRISPNTYHLIPSKQQFFNRLREKIKQEQHFIKLQYYTIEMDDSTRPIKEDLIAAKRANPNLIIQVVADDSNNMFHGGERIRRGNDAQKRRDETYAELNELKNKGIEVAVTNHVNVLLLKANFVHRDHKKLALFGGSDFTPPTAFVGSANLQDVPWKEVIVEMTGNMIPVIQQDFDDTIGRARELKRVHTTKNPVEWYQKYGKENIRRLIRGPQKTRQEAWKKLRTDIRGGIARNAESVGKRINYDLEEPGDKKGGVYATDSFPFMIFPFRRGRIYATREHYQTIQSAHATHTLDVVTPYPGIIFLTSRLLAARRRGAQVNLIIPNKNNHLLYNPDRAKDYGFLRNSPLLKPVELLATSINSLWEHFLRFGGVTIYKYQGKKEGNEDMVHAKYTLLTRSDGTRKTVLGSTNISLGPISGFNREDVITTEDASLGSQLAEYTTALKKDSVISTGRKC